MKRSRLLVVLAVLLAACGDEPAAPKTPSAFTTGGAATASPSVTVSAARGGVVEGAFVELFAPDSEKRSDWRQTGPDGVARFDGLDVARRLRLLVSPPRDRDDLVPEELDGWTPSDTTVRLGAAGTIAGRVVDAKGAPWPNPAVFIRGDETVRLRASSSADAQGRFLVKGLRAGQEIEIAATDRALIDDALAANREPYHPGVWTLHKAGEKDVVVTVDLPSDPR